MSATRSVSGEFAAYRIGDTSLFTGGSGELFAIEGRTELLYKELHVPLEDRHVGRVKNLVEVGREIKDRSDLRGDVKRIAWPIDLAIDSGTVTGIVIPRAGNEYFRATQMKSLPQNFGHLTGQGAPPAKQRLHIIRQLAGVLAVLDRHELVHGDVSTTNLLWTLQPRPSLQLIDCDSIHPRGFVIGPYWTEHWKDPRLQAELIARHDTQSDWYALALAVYRAIVLNSRAPPNIRDLKRIAAELPASITESLIQVFGNPLDPDARVTPKSWKANLGAVVENAEDCARIEAITRNRPATVAGRRRARSMRAGSSRQEPHQQAAPPAVVGTPQAQATILPPLRPSGAGRPRPSAGAGPRKQHGSPKRAGYGHLFKRALLTATVAIGGTFTLYHFTGLPNWPILNTLNPFLSAQQRALVGALAPGVLHCHSQQPVPAPGAQAIVRCEWDNREFIAIKFANTRAMHAYYLKRLAIARRLTSNEKIPRQCPRAGPWYRDEHHHRLGEATSFIAADGARLDWSRTASSIYNISMGSSSELGRLCTWWIELNSP